jgi:hypothetical protein
LLAGFLGGKLADFNGPKQDDKTADVIAAAKAAISETTLSELGDE